MGIGRLSIESLDEITQRLTAEGCSYEDADDLLAHITALQTENESLKRREDWVKTQINGCIDYAIYVNRHWTTEASRCLLGDLRDALAFLQMEVIS